MNRTVPDEVLNSWPPDLWLAGEDVQALAEDLRSGAHLVGRGGGPVQLRVWNQNPAAMVQPDRMALHADDEIIGVVVSALGHLDAVYDGGVGRRWPLNRYTVLVTQHTEYSMVDVAFCPDPTNFVDGIPFEIADKGMYINGPGVQLILAADDHSLIRTVYMR